MVSTVALKQEGPWGNTGSCVLEVRWQTQDNIKGYSVGLRQALGQTPTLRHGILLLSPDCW